MTTFVISDVPLDARPLVTASLAQSLRHLRVRDGEASGDNVATMSGFRLTAPAPEDGLDEAPSVHPFVRAVHEAFANHAPLALSPDDVWLTIAQGFAMHVSQHAEMLRRQFVRHDGKLTLLVIRDHFVKGAPSNDWPGVFNELAAQIGAHIGPKKVDLLASRFSTTGPIERAASEIVLMDAMKNYFDFRLLTRCGIPRLTLLGTAADWRDIERRAAALGEFEGCGEWIEALGRVLAEFTAAAEGRPRQDFWRSLYKIGGGSGGPYVSGAINVFFPYVCGSRAGELRPNVMVGEWLRGEPNRREHGINPSAFPIGLAKVPFIWDYLGTELPMELLGGFVGVAQEETSLTVRPAIGWLVRDRLS